MLPKTPENMTKNQFNIKQKISKTELSEIKNWLHIELKESPNDKGFYHNWNIIEQAYLDNKMFIIKNETSVIGFLVWTKKEICAEIDIFEIIPSYRKQGIGEYFFNEVCKYWLENNLKVLKLFCEPKESEKFWKKMNFIKFPDIKYSISELTYYKPLILTNKSGTEIDEKNKLELWNVEPYQIEKNEPKWTWNIDNENFLPFLNPCNPNWNIRYTKNGKILKDDKIKRFDENRNINFGEFIFIEKIIEE